MLNKIRRRWRTESEHFRRLSPDSRHLFLSYVLFLAAYPLMATFMNAYLWRSHGTLWSIVLYNAGYVIGLPLGFYANGLLLPRYHALRLYFMGALLQALTPILVIFFPLGFQLGILVYGLVYGLGAGLFWGNKNYLDLQVTRGGNRIYYNSLGEISDFLMNIIMPASVGWFIVLAGGGTMATYIPAYKIVFFVAFLLLFLSGLVVQSSHIGQIHINSMVLRKPRHIWKHMRLFNFLFNLQVGTSLVLPNVIILTLVGNEGMLGTIQTITALISSAALYVIGRKSSISMAPAFVFFGSVALLVTTVLLAASFSWIGAIAYTVGITLAWASQWAPSVSVGMDLMDTLEPDTEKQYAYICDNELFYNIGRFVGIGLVSAIAITISQNTSLRYAPLIIGVLQLPLSWLVSRMVWEIKQKAL